MEKHTVVRCIAVALVTIVAGCTPQIVFEPQVPYTAIDAWREGASLQIRYLGPEGLVYSHSDWQDEVEKMPSNGDAVSLFVVNPDATGRIPPAGAEHGSKLPVLGPADYRRVRSAVIDPILPVDRDAAVIVDIQGTDVVLWYDDEGTLLSSLEQPPEGMPVKRHGSLNDQLSAGPRIVAEILEARGIDGGEVLFNTGDAGDDALPFLYANVETGNAAFIRVQPLGLPAAGGGDTITPVTNTLFHVIRSHTTALVSQPVSSLFRLLFMVGDAAIDTLDPAWTLPLNPDPPPPVANRPGMDLEAFEADLDRLTGRKSSRGTVSYLIDGQDYFTRLEEVVRNAKSKIELRTYIFDNDDYALEFADLLKDRAADGLSVKVLMDGLGTLTAAQQMPPELPEGFEPPPSIYNYLRDGSSVRVRDVVNPFFTGDHTKTTIIDQEIAFLGGMNIGREYRYVWHDMMAEVQGPVVAELGDDFDYAWASAGPFGDLAEFASRMGRDRKPVGEGSYPVRVLFTRPTASEIRNAQLAAIRRAQSYIYIENAYFTDDNFLYELVQARRRGVDVRVVIPLASDRGVLTQDNILAANVMFRNGLRVYIYPGMSHVKAAVYDGWACLGSANIDQLSLRVNREANIATSAPEAVQPLLDELFETDFRSSPEMTEPFPVEWHSRLWEFVGDYIF